MFHSEGPILTFTCDKFPALQEAGYKVTIASPSGGKIPIDNNSLQGDFKTPITAKWLDDGEVLGNKSILMVPIPVFPAVYSEIAHVFFLLLQNS